VAKKIEFCYKAGTVGSGEERITPIFAILFYMTIAYYKYIVTG